MSAATRRKIGLVMAAAAATMLAAALPSAADRPGEDGDQDGMVVISAPAPAPSSAGCSPDKSWRVDDPDTNNLPNYSSIYRVNLDYAEHAVDYWGWAEWRYYSGPGCPGAQWLVVHSSAEASEASTSLRRVVDGQRLPGPIGTFAGGDVGATGWIAASDSLICADGLTVAAGSPYMLEFRPFGPANGPHAFCG